jgi:hypothetical protein
LEDIASVCTQKKTAAFRTGRENREPDGRVDKGSDNIIIFACRGGSPIL